MIESSDNNNSFTKTICSICYEDLKPIVEDLQSISVCGHVFHELCLQQWFEYCSSTKKCTCPVCKQGCKAKDASRLYFQSIGDSVSTDPSLTQRLQNNVRDEDPEALRRELRRLEIKVVGLDSVVERQGKELKDVNAELCLRKEFEKKETSLKNEALKEKALVQQLLRAKTEALDKSTLECLRLQERSMGLAKELASIKLVSDFELDEDEVMKLASFGNGGKSQDTIDILRKSLVMRNKSYKALMVKCNALGRGESRSTQKLEKAKEKISRLKERVKELEIAAETKENDVLRGLRASKKTCYEGAITNLSHTKLPESQRKPGLEPIHIFDLSRSSAQNSKIANDYNVHHIQDVPKAIAHNIEKKTCSVIGAHLSDSRKNTHVVPNSDPKPVTNEGIVFFDSTTNRPNEISNLKNSPSVGHRNIPTRVFSSRTSTGTASETDVIDIDDDVIEVQDNAAQEKPVLNIRKELSTSQPFANPGDACFSGGLLGPDGMSRYLGKWCKRSQNKEMPDDGNTDLISVGPDGRGGTVKVLRSRNQASMSMDSKFASAGTKRLKLGGKLNTQQSRGSLQIEHFFGRATD